MTMRRLLPALLALLLFLPASACWTMTHTVGRGAPTHGGAKTESVRQWFILWGLVELNRVDAGDMAQGAKDYTITTQESFVDVLIGLVTGLASIRPRTVTVTR